MNDELITPETDLEPITIEQMIALAPSLFTASARFLRIEAKRTPPRTHVNTAQPKALDKRRAKFNALVARLHVPQYTSITTAPATKARPGVGAFASI